MRITATDVINNVETVLNAIMKAIEGKEVLCSKVGILKAPKKYEKVVRGKDGLSDKQREANIAQRKVNRPNREDLFEMVKNIPFTEIGKKYGVSDKSIVKWCKSYGLPYRKKDINKV